MAEQVETAGLADLVAATLEMAQHFVMLAGLAAVSTITADPLILAVVTRGLHFLGAAAEVVGAQG
jgi:hypothetical protein